MTQEPFRYTEAIDTKIVSAVEADLKTKVTSSTKMRSGIGNHVYRVETTEKPVIARVFRNSGINESIKIFWIDEQLAKQGVPHAKTLHYDRNTMIFPYGYMVEQLIEGKQVNEAVREGILTEEEYDNQLAIIFKRIHQISPKMFGELDNGEGTDESFTGYTLKTLANANDKLRSIEGFDKSLYDQTVRKVEQILKPKDNRFKPSLVHGDPGADNCIYSPDKEVVLIDWEHAHSSIWLDDFAVLTFWASSGGNTEGSMSMREKSMKLFTGVDRNPVFSDQEISELLTALDLVYAFKLLPIFLLDQQNQSTYDFLISKIKTNLK